ncbi:MAG: ceramidase domain-containing protein [Pseudomonadota bacterium]
MNRKIFEYCERGFDPGFWAEPLNAVTNAAFIIAALIATIMWLRVPASERRWVDAWLLLLLYAIGTGSFLFHTFATPWAALADVIPIGIFMVSYMAYVLRRFFGLSWLITGACLVIFVISLWQSSVVRCDGGPCLNGSVAYAPAFIALIVLGGILALKGHVAGSSLVAAGLIFAVSLTFRTIDGALCATTALPNGHPVGYHFLWHILNATLLFILCRAAIRFGGDQENT